MPRIHLGYRRYPVLVVILQVLTLDSKVVLRVSLALMLAIRCRSKEACLQLMARMYSNMDENQVKTLMFRLIYMLTPADRDWLKGLA